MSAEVAALGWAALLAFVQLVLYAVPANRELGVGYTMGPRDEERGPTGIGGRLRRAYFNHIEGLVLFAVAVLTLEMGDANSGATAMAAWIYLAARVAYVPAYAAGIPVLRSAIWAAGAGATVFILMSALL
ncbi:MAG: MAPEG family protein [Pseudomonadota bacterium]